MYLGTDGGLGRRRAPRADRKELPRRERHWALSERKENHKTELSESKFGGQRGSIEQRGRNGGKKKQHSVLSCYGAAGVGCAAAGRAANVGCRACGGRRTAAM